MNLLALTRLSAAAAACVLLSTGCGGEGGAVSMNSASTTTPRYSQQLTVTFTGAGLGSGVEVKVDGPCSNPTRSSASTATVLIYTCLVHGVGRVTPMLVDSADGKVYGSVKVDVPQPQVTMQVTDGTRSGSMLLELDPAAAPRSVERFMAFLSEGFYVDTLFHRVRPDVAVLGGGFVSSAAGIISAKVNDKKNLALEKNSLKNVRGAIAMYRPEGPDSANSMFFINTVDNPQFDADSVQTPDGQAVFGRVVQGLDVLDEIAKVPVRPDLSLGVNDVPVTAVRIRAALQTR
jgi:cyclophilin family peptidyl-prolyl cis-trans isomerase